MPASRRSERRPASAGAPRSGTWRLGRRCTPAVERWLLTALTQRAALAFNLGALVATIYLVTVRALAFAWSTTLEVDPAVMTRFFQLMATPWRWLTLAVPTRELVEASRYFPGRSYDPDLLGDWWPFLVAALVTYGLLPRVLLATYAAYRTTAARRALALDHGECAGVCERLLRPRASSGVASTSARRSRRRRAARRRPKRRCL